MIKQNKWLRKGSSALEFLIVIPIIALAINLVIYIGAMAYSKAAAQAVTYSSTVSAARYGLDASASLETGSWAEVIFQPMWESMAYYRKCDGGRVRGGCSEMNYVLPNQDAFGTHQVVTDYSYFYFSPFISDNMGVLGN